MDTTLLEYPVVIIGAGPTGLLLANILGQAKIKTLIVDRNGSVSQHPKAILLDDEGFRSLQGIGVAEEVKEKCLMGYGAKYFNENMECFASIESWTGEYGYPRRNSFLQPELEQVLNNRLENWPSVTLMRSCELKSFTQNEQGVHAFLESSDGPIEVNSKLLLGCDGGRSQVRETLGIELDGFDAECDWLVLDTESDADQDRFTKFVCDYKRPAVSIPAPSGGRRYEFMVMPGDDSQKMLELETVQKLVKPFRKELKAEDLTRAALYRFHARVAKSFMEGRCFLLGDACHMSPPFAGQGMNAGLRDSQNLGWKIARVINEESPLCLLQTYAEERMQNIRDMIQFAVSLGEIVMPKNDLDSKIMSTLWKLTNLIPEAKEYVQKMKFKPKPYCTKGAFLFECSDGESSAIGKMLPQPLVSRKNKEDVLLDEVLGSGFALVGIGLESLGKLQTLSHKLLDESKLKRVLLLKESEKAQQIATYQTEVVYLKEETLRDPAFKILKEENQIFLLRPDRYVLLQSNSEKAMDHFELLNKILA